MSQFNKYLEIVQEGKDYSYNEILGVFKRSSLTLKEIEFLENFHEAHGKQISLRNEIQEFKINPKTNFTTTYGVNSKEIIKLFENMNKIIGENALIFSMSNDSATTASNPTTYKITLDLEKIRNFLANMAKQINEELSGTKDNKKIEKAMNLERDVRTTRYRLLSLYRFF
jgi:hypothetical protein